MKHNYLILFIALLGTTTLSAQNGTLAGRITDAKTGEPLIGATILLEGTDLGTATDIDGYYLLENIPPQSYNVEASYVGYTPLTKFNIVIRSEGNPDLNFELESGAVDIEEIVVRPNPFEKTQETPLSIQKLSQEEVATYPGGNNDIAKVVQSLPGVSGSIGGFRNDVIIRGGAPNENVYYLDGVEIPNINHFATQGSAGGPVGMLNVSFFEGVELATSAFGAQYDNALSSVLQFDQRTGNARKFQGNFRLGASESALTLEGPLFKGDNERSKTTFIVSARRSYLQLLFQLLDLPFLPDYWDYQYKIAHQIDDYNELIFTGVGSIDDFSVNELDEFDEEQQANQEQVPVIRQKTNSMGLTWKHRLKDNSGLMQTTLSSNVLNNEFLRYRDNVNETGLFFKNDSKEQETKLRYRYTKFLGNWTTSAGFSVQLANYENNTSDLVNDFTYNTDINFVKYGFHLNGATRVWDDRLGISLGIRADGNSFTDNGNDLLATLSPRVAFNYRLTEDARWNANASVGRYYKIPPYTILGFQNNQGANINASTEYIRSDHFVAGLEYLLTPSSRITLEGFVKLYDQYPVSLTDSISLANQGGGFEVLGNEPVASVGKGRTYGAELLFQQKFSGKFYAVTSLTLYQSEFTGFDTDEYIRSTWDNQFLVSLLGGYKFGRNWEVSARYRYIGPTPYPPVDEAATLANYPSIIVDYSRLGAIELDAFSQMDIRVDKKWNFEKFSLDVFLDIQNALSGSTPSEPLYGLLRNEQGDIQEPQQLVEIDAEESSTVLPSFGVVINF